MGWRSISVAAAACLLVGSLAGGLLVPLLDGAPRAQGQVRVETTFLLDEFLFDPARLVVEPGASLSFFLDNIGDARHTFTVFNTVNESLPLGDNDVFLAFYQDQLDADNVIVDVNLAIDGVGWANFTAPSTVGIYPFACVVTGHAVSGMWGLLVVGQVGEPGADGPPSGIEGVALRAYWIGLIGIFSMVAVIVVAYFLIKYESRHHTDHRDHKRRDLP